MQDTLKAVRVFLSSTFTDLQDERVAVMEALERTTPLFKPILMDFTKSDAKHYTNVLKENIMSADIFLLLIGERFSDAVMYEYELARALNKWILVFVKKVSKRESRATEFLRHIPLKWTEFKSIDELRHVVVNSFAQRLVEGYQRFNMRSSDFKEPYGGVV